MGCPVMTHRTGPRLTRRALRSYFPAGKWAGRVQPLSEQGVVLYDLVGRLETFDADLARLRKAAGLPDAPLEVRLGKRACSTGGAICSGRSRRYTPDTSSCTGTEPFSSCTTAVRRIEELPAVNPVGDRCIAARHAWCVAAQSKQAGDAERRELEARELAVQKREQAASEREHIADVRERVADQRERIADQRERFNDERELRADQRDTLAAEQQLRTDQLARALGILTETTEQRAVEALDRARSRLAESKANLDRTEASIARRRAQASRSQAEVNREVAATERDQQRHPDSN